MKKMFTAILLFDLMAGLLFFGFYEMKHGITAVDGKALSSGGTAEEDAAARGESMAQSGGMEGNVEEDVKKIAITFDGDVIIGLSQGIC